MSLPIVFYEGRAYNVNNLMKPTSLEIERDILRSVLILDLRENFFSKIIGKLSIKSVHKCFTN